MLSAFLDQNEPLWVSKVDTESNWDNLFRTALRMEAALFRSPLHFVPPPYTLTFDDVENK